MDARRYTRPRIPSNDVDNLVQSPEGLPPLADISEALSRGREPPPSEKTYQPMQIKRPAVYRQLVSMTRSKP